MDILVDSENYQNDTYKLIHALSSRPWERSLNLNGIRFKKLFQLWKNYVDWNGTTALMEICKNNSYILNINLSWMDELLYLHSNKINDENETALGIVLKNENVEFGGT